MIADTEQTITFAEFELDRARRRLVRDGEPVVLYAKTFDLLDFLVERNGKVVTKDEILEAVWPGQFVEEANLSVQISALRKALGEAKHDPRFLITIPGVGYKFVANVRNDAEEIVIERHTIERVLSEDGVGTERRALPPARRTSRWIVAAVVGIALAALGIGGFWLTGKLQDRDSATTPKTEAQPKIKRLTNHGRVNSAALSPDGKFFAYSFVERGSLRTELRLGQTNGGNETVLRPVGDVRYYPRTFSPSGSWLYYTQSELRQEIGSLYRIPAAGGVPQKLADNVPIWLNVSSDEKQIAFIRENKEDMTSELVVADVSGSNERKLAVRPAVKHFFSDSQSWSPDGKFIAVAAANGPNRKNASNKHYEIFVIGTVDGAVRQLTTLEWNTVDTLDWLQDGSGVVAIARDKDKSVELQVWQVDYPTGSATLLSRDPNTYAGEVSSSADSNSLVIVQREMEANVWVAPADDLKNARQITFSSSGRMDGWYGMDFAPDGQIVYTAWIDQSLTLWTMDADGANARQLTSTGFRDEKPAVSSDGRFIVFQSNRSGNTEIWRMEVGSGNLQQLTTTGGNSAPDVTPDGNWVVFRHQADDGTDTIWRVPIGGGDPVQITTTESFNARVSPDGKSIACAYEVDKKVMLAVLPFEGGEPVRLFDVGKLANFSYRISWSPDGKFITYPDRASGIWKQAVEGGEPQRLEGLPAEMTFTHAWSRDGKSLAFGRTREIREAVLISEFR